MARTQLRFVKDRVYAVTSCPSDPQPSWYFYYSDYSQGLWRCFLHDPDGEVIEEVGSGLPITDELQICLPDAAGYPHAARLVREPTRLSILDFEADRSIDYLVPDPWVAGPAQWVDSAFYWIEWQPAQFQDHTVTRLMTAEREFLEPQQIGADFQLSVAANGDWTKSFEPPTSRPRPQRSTSKPSPSNSSGYGFASTWRPGKVRKEQRSTSSRRPSRRAVGL